MSESSRSAMKPFKFQRKDNKFMVLDHQGILYFVDLSNKDMSQFHDTGPNSYQALQYPNVKDYVDLGEDGETLCHYSPGSRKRISGNSIAELSAKLFQIFQTHVQSTYDENFTRKEDFEIFIREWCFSIDNSQWPIILAPISKSPSCRVLVLPLVQTPISTESHKVKIDQLEVIVLSSNLLRAIHAMTEVASDTKGFNISPLILPSMTEVASVTRKALTSLRQSCHPRLALIISTSAKYKHSEKQGIHTGIVEALKELHSNQAFHHNFAPEHVLLRVSTRGVVVKLCGLGSSILTKKPFISDNYLATETLRLGKTLWNLLSNGKYNFKEDYIPSDFVCPPISNPNLDGLEPIPADLIRKLVSQNITLEGVLLHPIFWSANTVVTFIKGVSKRLMTEEFNRSKFNTFSFSAFGNNWLLEDNQYFKEWFIRMNDTFEGPKWHEMAVPTTWLKNWEDPTTFERDGVMHFESAYNTTELNDLVKLICNTANHRQPIYPANDNTSLHEFVSSNYPHMLMVVYNYIYHVTGDYYPRWC
nr:hypothetical protein [Tanacetum cinerariifolium]